jgi:prepilin-type processing-associated H-X9-DG protein
MRKAMSVPSGATRRGVFRAAFTLVELLAVASCVTVLLAVVAPSISAALGKSRYAGCLERLRAIGQASRTYSANDAVESAIPVHEKQFQQDPYHPILIGAYEWGGKSGIGWPTWIQGYADTGLGSRYGTKAGFGPATRPLNNVLYPHGFRDNNSPWNRNGAKLDTELPLDAYRCPADDGPPLAAHCPDWVNNPARTSFDHFGTSYAANNFMNSSSGGAIVFSNSPYLRRLSQVPNPARTLNYEENIGRWAWACKNEQPTCFEVVGPGVDPGPTKSVRGWHGKDWTYNYAFVDGHADKRQIYRDGTEDSGGYGQHHAAEELSSYPVSPDCRQCAPGADDCPGDEGSFEQYRCIIIRGDGWQKDTMPAPLICTGLSYRGYGRPSYEYCVEGAP